MNNIITLDQECVKCKSTSYFYKKDKGNVVGLYCSSCGRFLKWANKQEKMLIFIRENSHYGVVWDRRAE